VCFYPQVSVAAKSDLNYVGALLMPNLYRAQRIKYASFESEDLGWGNGILTRHVMKRVHGVGNRRHTVRRLLIGWISGRHVVYTSGLSFVCRRRSVSLLSTRSRNLAAFVLSLYGLPSIPHVTSNAVCDSVLIQTDAVADQAEKPTRAFTPHPKISAKLNFTTFRFPIIAETHEPTFTAVTDGQPKHDGGHDGPSCPPSFSSVNVVGRPGGPTTLKRYRMKERILT